MMRCGSDSAPDPKEWLALDEHERIALCEKYHHLARIKLPTAITHAAFHAMVENQIAQAVTGPAGPSAGAGADNRVRRPDRR